MIRENDKASHGAYTCNPEVQHNESIHCVYIVHFLLFISSLGYINFIAVVISIETRVGSYKSFLPADPKLMCLECSGLLKSSCASEVGTHHLLPMPVRVAGLRRELIQLERNERSTFYVTHKSPL